MSTRDPQAVEPSLVELMRALSSRAGRPAEELEARTALAALNPAQLTVLKSHAAGAPPAKPLGPMAWADIARGVDAQVAAARELGGYYEVEAERDALALIDAAKKKQKKAKAEAVDFPEEAAQVKAVAAQVIERAASEGTLPLKKAQQKRVKDDVELKLDEPVDAAPRAKAAKQDDEAAPRARKSEKPAAARTPAKADAEVEAAPRPEKLPKRAQELLTLYAYHRDHPLVARALRLSLAEVELEIAKFGLRRRVQALVRASDHTLPAAQSVVGASSGPTLRVRKGGEKPQPKPAPESVTSRTTEAQQTATDTPAAGAPKAWGQPPKRVVENVRKPKPAPVQRVELPTRPAKAEPEGWPEFTQDELKAILRQLGPRRHLLQDRMGRPGRPLPTPLLLNAFRAAGLEREFGQRERDLVRGLLSRHRGSYAPIAAELMITVARLEQLLKERGLTKEFDDVRKTYQDQARARRWPKEQLEQLLKEKERLLDLGVYSELLRAAGEKVKLSWERDPKASQPARLSRLAKELKISSADAKALATLLSLS